MTYEEYAASAHRGAELVDKGNLEEALAIFKELADSDLALPDRSAMALNVATVCVKMNQLENALVWYGTAVDLEKKYHGRRAFEARAMYLAEIGRRDESLTQFQQLSADLSLNEADKHRIAGFIKQLQDQRR